MKILKIGCVTLLALIALGVVTSIIQKTRYETDPSYKKKTDQEAIEREVNAKKDAEKRAVERAKEAEEAKQRRILRSPQDQMEISKFDWEHSGFGSVMIAHLTIKNNNTFAVKDIVVSCETTAASGTKLSNTRATIYEIIPAGGSKRFEKVNLGFMNSQSKRASCDITSATSMP